MTWLTKDRYLESLVKYGVDFMVELLVVATEDIPILEQIKKSIDICNTSPVIVFLL